LTAHTPLGCPAGVPDLRIQQPDVDATLEDWRYVHNTTIPTHHLSLADVRERAGRHHLEVAYADDALVGCSTVRPSTDAEPTTIVIARVLAPFRRNGYGQHLYERCLDRARELGAEAIGTVVLESNEDGLRFALRHGFVETERYVLPGETIPWIDLRLT
jgi:GNAT superfamily N-acetyltransferase